jgi:hypothetical protein
MSTSSNAALAAVVAVACVSCSVRVSNDEAPGADPVSTSSTLRPARSSRNPASAESVEAEEETDEQAWKAISEELGKPGELKENVYRFVFPRDDLDVTVEGNEVPAAAGIASEFRFYRCPCGRINVLGQFVVADYEANDVVDALREGQVEVASLGPLLLHERPRLMLVRFFGENKSGRALATTLRSALSWTGKERMAPQKVD